MRLKFKQLFILTFLFILFSINIVNCATYDESINSTSFFWSGDFWEKVYYAIIGAALTLIVTIIGNFVNERRQLKYKARKQLSYEIITKKDLVEVDKEISNNVKVLYKDSQIENLYYVACDIQNSGNTVIKNQYARFEFPTDTRIIDTFFDPLPEREINLKEEKDSELNLYELKYKIGHLECGQQVSYRFILTSKSPDVTPKIYPFNEEGDVSFVSKSRSKSYEEKNDILSFITLYLYLLLIPSAFKILGSGGNFAANILSLILIVYISPYIKPFAKAVAELITRINDRKMLNVDSKIVVGGDNVNGVVIGTKIDNE